MLGNPDGPEFTVRDGYAEVNQPDERLERLRPNLQERIEKRQEMQKAKIAVARHMTEIAWHMLTNVEEYRMKNVSVHVHSRSVPMGVSGWWQLGVD